MKVFYTVLQITVRSYTIDVAFTGWLLTDIRNGEQFSMRRTGKQKVVTEVSTSNTDSVPISVLSGYHKRNDHYGNKQGSMIWTVQ